MDIQRVARHLLMTQWQVHRVFSAETLGAIEQAIKASESVHTGEVRFAVEGMLDTVPLLKGQTARERAIDVFSQLRVWDTQANNGVLIYLLLADRDVEIIADRGIHTRVGPPAWENICRAMEAEFTQGCFREGVIGGIQALTGLLAQHFPAQGHNPDELPDAPVVL